MRRYWLDGMTAVVRRDRSQFLRLSASWALSARRRCVAPAASGTWRCRPHCPASARRRPVARNDRPDDGSCPFFRRVRRQSLAPTPPFFCHRAERWALTPCGGRHPGALHTRSSQQGQIELQTGIGHGGNVTLNANLPKRQHLYESTPWPEIVDWSGAPWFRGCCSSSAAPALGWNPGEAPSLAPEVFG